MNKVELFRYLYKKHVAEYSNYSFSTTCEFTENGYKNCDQVIDRVLKPILSKCNYIGMPGYKDKWWYMAEKGQIPDWVRKLNKQIYKEGRRYYLHSDSKDSDQLNGFWENPNFSARDKLDNQIKVFSPGIPLINIDLNKIPFKDLLKLSNFGGPHGNLWSHIKIVKKWIDIVPDKSIFIVLNSGIKSINLIGDPSIISLMVDKVFQYGYQSDIFEDYINANEDLLMLKQGETNEKAAERIWKVNLQSGKLF